jgi:hypothetical protein
VICVDNQSRHLAATNVKQGGAFCCRLADVNSARFAVPFGVRKHEDTLVIEFTVVVGDSTEALPGPQNSRQPSAIPARPVQLPAAGLSARTNSISGCAHSTEPNQSPRSQFA